MKGSEIRSEAVVSCVHECWGIHMNQQRMWAHLVLVASQLSNFVVCKRLVCRCHHYITLFITLAELRTSCDASALKRNPFALSVDAHAFVT